MEIIKFGDENGSLWPWEYAIKIEGNIYKAGSTVLEIDTEKEPIFIREHGWVKESTYYHNIPNLSVKTQCAFNRRVFNIIMKYCTACVLLDYHHKIKVKWKKEDLNKLKPRMRVSGDDLIIPIDEVEEYTPDKKYKQYVKS